MAVSADQLPRSTWLISRISRDDGLPSGQVHNATVGADRMLMMATPAGLAMHDGVGATILTIHDGLSCNGLRAVAAAPAGHLWIGSDVGLDVRCPDGSIIQPGDADQPGVVSSVVADDTGAWVATTSGLHRAELFTETANPSIRMQLHLPGQQVHMVLHDGRGDTVALTTNGVLYRLTGTEWQPFQTEGYRTAGSIQCVAVDGPDTLLVGGSQGVCIIDRSGDLLSFTRTDTLGGTVATLLRFGDRVFAAIGPRLVVFDARSQHVMQAESVALEGSVINGLWSDHDENIWGSTQNQGMIRISGLHRFIEFPMLPDIGGIFAIHERPSGSLVLAGERGVLLPARRGRASQYRITFADMLAWDAIEPRIGQVIAATDQGVLTTDDRDTADFLVPAEPALRGRGRVLLQRGHETWIGTTAGLVRHDGQNTRLVLDGDGESLGYVYSLVEGLDGQLWVTTLGRGLWRESGGTLQRYMAAPVREKSNVYAVAEGPDGRIAILADGNLLVGADDISPQDWVVLQLPGAPWAVTYGPNNSLLVGTSDGLLICDADSGDIRRQIHPALGAEYWEFTTSRSLHHGLDGRTLCGLNGGLASIDTSGISSIQGAPEPYLAHVEWSGDNASLTETAHCNAGDLPEFEIDSGRWSVAVNVRTAWRIDETECTFSCRLSGFDHDWLPEDKYGRFRYTSLPVGSYVCEARVWSPLVRRGPTRELFRLTVRN